MTRKLDPARATAGRWHVVPTRMTMYGGERLPTFAVLATGPDVCEQFVGRVHPKSGLADEGPVVEMDARLFAASKTMATLLLRAVAYEEEAFAGDEPVDAGDLLQWFARWRQEACGVLEMAATDRSCNRSDLCP